MFAFFKKSLVWDIFYQEDSTNLSSTSVYGIDLGIHLLLGVFNLFVFLFGFWFFAPSILVRCPQPLDEVCKSPFYGGAAFSASLVCVGVFANMKPPLSS